MEIEALIAGKIVNAAGRSSERAVPAFEKHP
jgi:hypothetical protein